jgi:hypothetical protein
MTSAAKDEFTDVVENVISGQAGELAAKSANQSNQEAQIDVSREGSAKPTPRKRETKSTKRTQQARQTSVPEDKPKINASASAEEVITPVPQATNNASATVIGTARADFVADPEPVPQNGGFLCTFTLSRPGLVGLNKLAIRLNDLQDSGSIGGWQANGWEDTATKERALIRFVNRADAIIAIESAPKSSGLLLA